MKKKLSYQIYRPEHPKAVVVCVHGMQEHQQRYTDLAEYFVKNNYACITYDLPGHGKTAKTEENKGYFGDEDGWKQLVESAHDIVIIARNEFKNLPLIYFGHSMGTIIGRVFLQTYDYLIDGCILSGIPKYRPLCKMGLIFAKCYTTIFGKKNTSKLLEYLAIGSFNRKIEHPNTTVDWLSYNTRNIASFLDDEWCGFPFTNQGYVDLFTLMKKMGDDSLYQCKNKNLPIYIFAGEDDPCIGGRKGFTKSISLLHKVGYQQIQTHLFPHMRHETLHEQDADAVMETIVQWLDVNIIL